MAASSCEEARASTTVTVLGEREIVRTESIDQCICGNVFMHDSIFCRKCGRKRNPAPEVEAPPVWSWSDDNLGKRSWRKWSRWSHSALDSQFRFLDRDGPFGQSTGQWNIFRIASSSANGIRKLYRRDLYHTFIDGGTVRLHLLVYSAVYVSFFTLFAFVYHIIDDECSLGLEGNFLRAYYLSLETMVTIGYGVPDPYYGDCWEGAVVLTVQSLVQYFLNALVIGSVFVRLTRPQSRANTILFSSKAVIQVIDGHPYFMFQLCEAKHHDLLEAHVRCYCIRHDRSGSSTFQTLPMRLQHPDDDKGASLLLTFPQRVVHRIDNWSPLSPAADRKHRQQNFEVQRSNTANSNKDVSVEPQREHSVVQRAFWSYQWPEVPQRQVDAEQGSRDTCVCPKCGEAFQTTELLRRHTEYMAVQDEQSGIPAEFRHVRWSTLEFQSWAWSLEQAEKRSIFRMEPDRDAITEFINRRYIEVVVLVEGVEPTTSSTLQARHSYRLPEDMEWDMDFVDCIILGSAERRPCSVDLGRFHELVPVD